LPSPKNLFEYSAKTNVRFQGQWSQGGDPRFPHWSWEPQTLRRSRRKWWRDLLVDTLMFAVGLPFFALAAVVVRVNGRVAGTNELNVLEQCIRGVSSLPPPLSALLRQSRQLRHFLSYFQSLLGGPWSSLHHGNLNEEPQLGCLSS
jgi:hypothetical protein